MANQIRRYRQNKKAASGTTILACVLAVVVVLAAALLVLTVTGRLDGLLGGKKPAVTDPTEDTEPAAETPGETGSETGSETEPETDPVTEPAVTEPETQPEETKPGTTKHLDLTYEDLGTGLLVLIDAEHEYQFPKASGTTVVYGKKNVSYGLANSTIELNPEALNALNAMMADFSAATDKWDVLLASGYRSYDYQKDLFDQYGKSSTFEPGHTDYHSGNSFYLKTYNASAGTREVDKSGDEYAWIAENAWKYGFICRYPTAKKNVIGGLTDGTGHYRYVGKAHAAAMHEHNWCLEEYLEYVKDYTYASPMTVVDADGTAYSIYYAACDLNSIVRIPVSDTVPYHVSGNNYDGFVVCTQK